MRIEYLGHASFLIESSSGIRIVTDPYQPGAFGALRLKPLDVEADLVTVSHDHLDHNYVRGVGGNPKVIKNPGTHEFGEISITGFPSFHDESKGRERGSNIIFVIEADGLRIMHCGDLGHKLIMEDKKEIGDVDIMLIPVGGTFTVDADTAWEIIDLIKPSIVIPMHYKVSCVDLPIGPVEDFIRNKPNVKRIDGSSVKIELPLPDDTEVWILNPSRA